MSFQINQLTPFGNRASKTFVPEWFEIFTPNHCALICQFAACLELNMAGKKMCCLSIPGPTWQLSLYDRSASFTATSLSSFSYTQHSPQIAYPSPTFTPPLYLLPHHCTSEEVPQMLSKEANADFKHKFTLLPASHYICRSSVFEKYILLAVKFMWVRKILNWDFALEIWNCIFSWPGQSQGLLSKYCCDA